MRFIMFPLHVEYFSLGVRQENEGRIAWSAVLGSKSLDDTGGDRAEDLIALAQGADLRRDRLQCQEVLLLARELVLLTLNLTLQRIERAD
jgi:hypothetical protein